MPYGETKVYFDGSHYIAIPHTTRKTKRRPKPVEEKIMVLDKEETEQPDDTVSGPVNSDVEIVQGETDEKDIVTKTESAPNHTLGREMTHKEYFEELYEKSKDMRRKERKKYILSAMLPYFENKQRAEDFVNVNFDRKIRNLITRKVRLWRKINLQEFNFFCTFTYDERKHTEESFSKRAKNHFSQFLL